MRIRLDWIPRALNVLAVVLLIPLIAHLAGIVIEYIAARWG